MDQNDGLTPSQRQAVEQTEGPLLVLAGPGSGKTRVITRRIARILEHGVDPARLLAITFTNKAAGEMCERVERLLPGVRIWISTFHRFCARILRRRPETVGLSSNFTILDTGDQRRMLRDVLHHLNYDVVHFPPERIAERISLAKNQLQTAEIFKAAREERVGDFLDSVVARAYPEYQRRLLESNAVDFDDLLLHVVTMLHENSEIREELDERFRYILVDEYQDTNRAQYQIVAALSRESPNLCVTGDPDQSIYGWRGARIENILRFEADYPQAVVIRLEENFRSTKAILRAADRLIAFNVRRKPKTMRTDNPEGASVEVLRFDDARAEAEGIAQAIKAGMESDQLRASDVAIFYRVNSLSRELEHALGQSRVPYQLAAGTAFYERAEIKDILAYLRLLLNPRDRSAFLRVVNVPPRGIGKKSLQRLVVWADSESLPLLDAAGRSSECPEMPSRAARSLATFAKLIDGLSRERTHSLRDLVELVLERMEYRSQWAGSPSEQDIQHLANIDEFVNAAQQFDATAPEQATIEGFLETTALVADVDSVDAAAERVTLMTLHAAKGLEFPVVYLIGLEQQILPHERALRSESSNEYEEERRLLFVGMTRARERLILTRAGIRPLRGRSLITIPSDFLREIGVAETVVPSTRPSRLADPGDEAHPIPPPEWDEAHETFPTEDEPGAQPHGASKSSQITEPGARRHPLLMTGADLLSAGSAPPTDLPAGFRVGMSVRHPRYGVGRIIKTSGFAKNRTVTVEFQDDGRSETFIASRNPLQPVGNG